MAGRGSRFADAGFTTPKPLIPVRGRPMYSWALEGLPTERAEKLIFICLASHLADTSLRTDIESRYGEKAVIVPIEDTTEGQACSVLCAKEWIDNDNPLLIFNADTFFKFDLEKTLVQVQREANGFLGVFEADGDEWSFARVDNRGRVVKTAEKNRISSLASTGLYHFSRGKDFVRYAEEMIEENERVNKEFYIAPVYNRMIEAGADIRVDKAVEVWALGTPDHLAAFEANYKE
jgi:NDP-sugar pyrophosphorylase family protein